MTDVASPRPFVVAIDGPAAAGKGTLALRLAEALGLAHLDTGLLYRAIGKLMAERGFSQQRACGLVQIDPKTVRREPEQGDAEVRERLRSLAAERRRFGYRRLGILLEREGVSMNKKRLFRLYREEGLAVRRRRGRKRATGTRAPMALPDGPNQRWSL